MEKINNKEKIINMYITARQFKNAILFDEFIILPAKQNNMPENSKMNFNIINLTFRGEKYLNKLYPFIVNKAFACEIYLKAILNAYNQNIPRDKHGHELSFLLSKVDEQISFSEMICQKFDLKLDDFIKEVENISNSFNKWRYAYENEKLIIHHMFLNYFCDSLDEYVKIMIKELYDYDCDKDCR